MTRSIFKKQPHLPCWALCTEYYCPSYACRSVLSEYGSVQRIAYSPTAGRRGNTQASNLLAPSSLAVANRNGRGDTCEKGVNRAECGVFACLSKVAPCSFPLLLVMPWPSVAQRRAFPIRFLSSSSFVFSLLSCRFASFSVVHGGCTWWPTLFFAAFLFSFFISPFTSFMRFVCCCLFVSLIVSFSFSSPSVSPFFHIIRSFPFRNDETNERKEGGWRLELRAPWRPLLTFRARKRAAKMAPAPGTGT